MACVKKSPMKTSTQSADVLRWKVVRCRNTCSEEHTKGVFIDGQRVNIQSEIRMFWGCEKDEHLLETAQFADMLLEQSCQVPSSVLALVHKNCFQRGRQTTPTLAAVGERRSESFKNSHYAMQTLRERSPLKKRSYGNCKTMDFT